MTNILSYTWGSIFLKDDIKSIVLDQVTFRRNLESSMAEVNTFFHLRKFWPVIYGLLPQYIPVAVIVFSAEPLFYSIYIVSNYSLVQAVYGL